MSTFWTDEELAQDHHRTAEAHYSVSVDNRGEHPVVRVLHHGRPIAHRTIRTIGDAMNLGGLLTDPSTPFLPVVEPW